jgi:integrase
MPTARLTDASVKRLPAPPGERVDYGDLAFPGLSLRVTGTVGARLERRTWTYTYRHNGTQRRLTLGQYPTLTLAQARDAAGKARQQVQAGADPARQEAKQRDTTVAIVAAMFVRMDLEGRDRKQKYIKDTRAIFANHVLPRWGDRDIKSITRTDVVHLLDDVKAKGTVSRDADGKRRKLDGGPIIANRTLAAVRALLNWSLRRGIIDSTPATLVEAPADEVKRDRVLTAIEIRAIWTAAITLGFPFGEFFQLAMLTGQRRNEVARMQWDHLDLNEALWTLPSAATKAGRTHVVPLSPMAATILKGLPRIAGPEAFVFTTTGRSPISGFTKVKERIDRVIASNGTALTDWTIHDLRRTAATEMARLGISEFIVSRVLNHASRGVTGTVYNRYQYAAEKRQALEAWAAYLTEITQRKTSTAG